MLKLLLLLEEGIFSVFVFSFLSDFTSTEASPFILLLLDEVGIFTNAAQLSSIPNPLPEGAVEDENGSTLSSFPLSGHISSKFEVLSSEIFANGSVPSKFVAFSPLLKLVKGSLLFVGDLFTESNAFDQSSLKTGPFELVVSFSNVGDLTTEFESMNESAVIFLLESIEGDGLALLLLCCILVISSLSAS